MWGTLWPGAAGLQFKYFIWQLVIKFDRFWQIKIPDKDGLNNKEIQIGFDNLQQEPTFYSDKDVSLKSKRWNWIWNNQNQNQKIPYDFCSGLTKFPKFILHISLDC